MTPRAVVGLLLVCALVLLVLGMRTVRAAQRSAPEPIPPVSTLPALGGATPGFSGTATGMTSPSPAPTATSVVAVHVVGQVRRPGVVELPAGARVQQALAAAGGPLRDADLARVNLARQVVDGEQVVVPRPGEPAATAAGPAPTAQASGPDAGPPVDLNAAGLAELDSLPGVGPVLAQRILDWRVANGQFTSVEELGEVSGIGDAVLGRLRGRVRV